MYLKKDFGIFEGRNFGEIFRGFVGVYVGFMWWLRQKQKLLDILLGFIRTYAGLYNFMQRI